MDGGGGGSSDMAGKKARKPYTITKPREKWGSDEHGRFLDALLMYVRITSHTFHSPPAALHLFRPPRRYGRDWKKIEEHVQTKTTVQVNGP